MGFGIVDRNWGLALGIGIGHGNWGLEIGIMNEDRTLGFGIIIGIENDKRIENFI